MRKTLDVLNAHSTHTPTYARVFQTAMQQRTDDCPGQCRLAERAASAARQDVLMQVARKQAGASKSRTVACARRPMCWRGAMRERAPVRIVPHARHCAEIAGFCSYPR